MRKGSKLASAYITSEAFRNSLAWRSSSALLVFAMVALLNACGGGGGSGSGGGAAPQQGSISKTNTATLFWGATTDTNVSGYRVYLRTAPDPFIEFMAVGKEFTSITVDALRPGTRYFFAVTTYDDTSGNESIFSNEVFKDVL